MARPRRTEEVPDVPEDDIPLPAGDSEQDEDYSSAPGWKPAYERAIKKGCAPKAARLYADTHHTDFEQGIDGVNEERLEAQIRALQGKLDAARGSRESAS